MHNYNYFSLLRILLEILRLFKYFIVNIINGYWWIVELIKQQYQIHLQVCLDIFTGLPIRYIVILLFIHCYSCVLVIILAFSLIVCYNEKVNYCSFKRRGGDMAISYKKLWKLLIDRDLKKKDLQQMSGVSAASITKLGRNENVNTEIIEKICLALNCDVSDIMEITDHKTN